MCVDSPSFACAALPPNAPFRLCFNARGQGKVNLGGKTIPLNRVCLSLLLSCSEATLFNKKQCLLPNANDLTKPPITPPPAERRSHSHSSGPRNEAKEQSQPSHIFFLSDVSQLYFIDFLSSKRGK